MEITSSTRRLVVTGGLVAALTGGSILVATAADASTGATAKAATATTPDTTASPLTLANNCVTFSQYKHGNILDDYHTNVYLHANCIQPQRVKIIMKNGHDSGCIQLTKDESMKTPFTSWSDDGKQPVVEQLDAC